MAANAHLDAGVVAELRQRLEQEQARLQDLLRTAAQQGTGTTDPLAVDPEDFGDMAQDITNADTEMALFANDQHLLGQVNRALQRLDDGLYGLSEVSGRPIPLERLQAIPWATTTVEESA